MAACGDICSGSGHKRVCYFTNWSMYRPGSAAYTVANVDPFLCTHLIYAFAEIDYHGNMKPQLATDSETDTYKEFNNLRMRNPDLKTLISVGGWNFGSKKFSQMAGVAAVRSRFVTSAVRFLRQHGFDGLDIDWEYPGLRGGSPKDRNNLVMLCKELRQAFEAEKSGSKRLLLTAAVPAAKSKMDIGFNIRALDRYLDLWNLMTYDYHGPWAGKTGHNSPLHPSAKETGAALMDNVAWTASEYVRRGASKHKMMIGLSMYGHSFRLKHPSHNRPLSSASLGPAGPLTRQPGFWAYYEVCQRIADGGRKVITDVEQRVPYYVERNLWISFDDVDSIKEKTRWLKRNGFGGFMAWSLDLDVFQRSLCSSVSSPYPLISAATGVLLDPSEPGSPDVPFITTTSPAVTTRAPTRQTTRTPERSSTRQSVVRSTRAPFVATTRAPAASTRVPVFSTRAPVASTRVPVRSTRAPVTPSRASVTSTRAPAVVTRTPDVTTTHSRSEFICGNRPYRGYSDPAKSLSLHRVLGRAHRIHRTCQTGTVFDEKIGVCVWPPATL
ncbi:hypothetical protein BaRGS_00025003, partial [Batillaria attramentaria]